MQFCFQKHRSGTWDPKDMFSAPSGHCVYMYNLSKAGKMDQKQHNILIVSHGLPIRQLIKILFEEFECVSKVPGPNNPTELLVAKKFRESCLNTSWSRFVIEVTGENHDNIKSAECQEVFCIGHLNEFFAIW